MISLPKSNSCQNGTILPILSINKFTRTTGIPRSRLEKLATDTISFYDPFVKKTKSKERIIDNPTGFLKEVQARICKRILNTIVFPDYIIGGIKGRNPLAHPMAHTKKPVVVTIDAKDCFLNITNKQIFHVWHKQLGCSPEVSHLATILTTFNGHVPLGASTSNHLAILTLLPILQRINSLASRFQFDAPTQYMDDMALSGHSLPDEFLTLVIKEFSRGNVKINRKKIRIMRSDMSQVVTGKVVNEKLTVPISERYKIRAALNSLSKMQFSDSGYKNLYDSIKGRINHIKTFHPVLAADMLKKLEGLEAAYKC